MGTLAEVAIAVKKNQREALATALSKLTQPLPITGAETRVVVKPSILDPEALGTPEDKITTIIDVIEYIPQKWQALNCHQSQIGHNSFFSRLPKEWRDEALGYEYFVCVHGCNFSDHKERDLFEGFHTQV